MKDVALHFERDPLGRLLEASRDDGIDGDDVTTWFTYDSLGDVLTEGDSFFGAGAERTHHYDNLGRPVYSKLGTETITRTFDPLDRLATISAAPSTTPVATFQYSTLGGPISRTLASGVKTIYGHDPLGRLEATVDQKPDGSKLAQWTWEIPLDGVARESVYLQPGLATTFSVLGSDTGGRLRAEQHGLTGSPFALSPTASTASADAAVNAKLTAAATRYKLGSRGSWTEVNKAGAINTITLDARDGYTNFAGVTPTFDAGGALTRDGATTFTYDAFGQLATYSSGSVGRAYRRDALGRIVSETDTATSASTRYAYDGLHRTFRRSPNGDVDVTLDGFGLDDHIVTILPSHARRYYHQDRLGSVYLVTNETGSPLERVRYTAYGEPTILNPANQIVPTTQIGNRFGFQGQQHDWATTLVDMRARTYRPTWGRFLTLDPMELAAGPNLYAFANSSPQSYTDPLGLYQEYQRVSMRLQAGPLGSWIWDHRAEILEGTIAQYDTPANRDEAEVAVDAAKGVGDAVLELKAQVDEVENNCGGAAMISDPKGCATWAGRKWVDTNAAPLQLMTALALVMAEPEETAEKFKQQYGHGSWVRALTHFGTAMVVGMAIPGPFDEMLAVIKAASAAERAVLEGGIVAASTEERLALGLSRTRFHRKGLVGRFAQKINAKTYWDYYENTSELKLLGTRLLGLMDDADSIHFNVSGMFDKKWSAADSLESGKWLSNGGVTDWEFRQVVTRFRDKATFYRDGKVVTLDELGLTAEQLELLIP
jgi:RHS repeat-associated protein